MEIETTAYGDMVVDVMMSEPSDMEVLEIVKLETVPVKFLEGVFVYFLQSFPDGGVGYAVSVSNRQFNISVTFFIKGKAIRNIEIELFLLECVSSLKLHVDILIVIEGID